MFVTDKGTEFYILPSNDKVIDEEEKNLKDEEENKVEEEDHEKTQEKQALGDFKDTSKFFFNDFFTTYLETVY